jgi:GNAT superfamily N-acetyltransferase
VSPVNIRPAEPADVPLVLALIAELADYERAPAAAVGTEELLRAALFGPKPVVEAVIAELDGTPVGFALFFTTFSTWLCLPGIWLEDLYVRPEHRRAGVGRALFTHVAEIAVARGCGRMEWTALDWNAPALSFYEGIGASVVDGWRTHRLEGTALKRAATQ